MFLTKGMENSNDCARSAVLLDCIEERQHL